MSDTKTTEKRPSIGALWEKTSQAGKQFWAGNIEINGKKMEIVVFPAPEDRSEKYPDALIFESRKRTDVAPAATTKAAAPKKNVATGVLPKTVNDVVTPEPSADYELPM
jgi:hypothetical protein